MSEDSYTGKAVRLATYAVPAVGLIPMLLSPSVVPLHIGGSSTRTAIYRRELIIDVDATLKSIDATIRRYSSLINGDADGQALVFAPRDATYADAYEWYASHPQVQGEAKGSESFESYYEDFGIWR